MAKKQTGSSKKRGKRYGKKRESPSMIRYTMGRRWVANRIRRLQRHLKRHPNDLQTAAALKAS